MAVTTDWTQCRLRSPWGEYCVKEYGHEGAHRDKWSFEWTAQPSA